MFIELSHSGITVGTVGCNLFMQLSASANANHRRMTNNYLAYKDHEEAFRMVESNQLAMTESKTFLDMTIRKRVKKWARSF